MKLRVWPFFFLFLMLLPALRAYAQPTAAFTFTPANGCSPITVQFTNQSAGSGLSYTWKFGNGNQSTIKDPTATYFNPGIYTVTLIVKDGSGNLDSVKKVVTVFSSPAAAISADKVAGCPPLTVNFKDATILGSANIISWQWDMGGGVTYTSQNPTHTFEQAGTYDITIVVKDNNGCLSTKTFNDYIKVLPQPQVSFTANNTAACDPPLTVNFTSQVITNYKSGETYFWEFGDGETSTQKNPSHTYESNGSFSVRVTVTDSGGCSKASSKSSLVNIGKEKASFYANTTTACEPFKIQFVNNSSPSMGGSTYSWNFGDGNRSSAKTPTHIYEKAGKYTVSLKVTSAGGCQDSLVRADYIEVLPKPKAAFSADKTQGCEIPFIVNFKNESSDQAILWIFGDSITSTQPNPSHTYLRADSFTVRQVVRGQNGCTDTATKVFYIKIKAPEVNFSANPDKGCVPLDVQFYNSSVSFDSFVGWDWSFGDGNSSTLKEPLHTYASEGTYTVILIGTTQQGCTASKSLTVQAGLKPKADFTATPLEGCIKDMIVKFTNLTNNGAIKAQSYRWEFGDGQSSEEENPVHHYDVASGEYNVTLIAKRNGCADTLVKEKLIKILPPWASFSFTVDKCEKDSVTFVSESDGADSLTWDFDDGTILKNVKNPVHIFQNPGIYNVKLTVNNNKTGCADDTVMKVTIGQTMFASWYLDPATGCAPFEADFTVYANGVSKFFWDFGDGDTSSEESPKHTYTKPGTYTVTLTIEDDTGCKITYVKEDYVSVSGPVLDYSVKPTSGCTPLTIALTDNTTSNVGILTRKWIIGGNTIVTDSNIITYTFTEPPADQTAGYPVALEVTDSNGCKVSAGEVVYATFPKPDFEMVPKATCTDVSYVFVPKTDGTAGKGPFTYLWDFGDNTTSKQESPPKTYTQQGQYEVTLTMTDANGCVATVTKTVTHEMKVPEAKFTAFPKDTSCPPLLVQFTDQSTKGFYDIAKWEWDFGNGKTSNLRNPSHIYLVPGKYTVRLKITDDNGCTDEFVVPTAVSVGGPVGSYTISSLKGCVPFTVTFRVSSKTATKFAYDFGNGVNPITTDTVVSFTYEQAGTYIPHIYLSNDTCIYDLPPIDTIEVAPLPEPDFTFSGACFGYTTQFEDLTNPMKGDVVAWKWDFDKNYTVIGNPDVEDPKVVYSKPGFYFVTLISTTSYGCSDTIAKKIKIGGLKADFTQSADHGCVGEQLSFTDKTFADTAILSWQWDFGDGNTSTLQNPVHTYFQKGMYDIRLVVSDYKGCSDTLYRDQFLVGDTIAPKAPDIYRVTVENDHEIKLVFSRYNDIDLAGYIIYRSSSGGAFSVMDTITGPNDTIYTDNSVNALHNVYCYRVQIMNICGFISQNSETHCSIDLTASPDINQAILNWSHYSGWNSVERYDIYREDVYNPGKFDLIGSVPGSMNAYADTDIICYRTHVYRIQAFEAGGNRQWSWSDTSATTPVYVPQVPANEVVRATVENDEYIRIEWSDRQDITVNNYMIEKSLDGVHYEIQQEPFGPDVLSYEDKRVKVDERPYYYRVQLRDSCGDLSPYSNIGKTILLKVDTNEVLRPRLTWTQYQYWENGVHHYDVEIKDGSGNFNKIGESEPEDTVFIDDSTDVNSLPFYCYRVIARKNGPSYQPESQLHITSTSNEDCSKVRSLLWVPNAFTPNDDFINDSFFVKGMYIKQYNIKIYNRWGTLVYESDDIYDKWDGTWKGAQPLPDAYRYLISAQGADGNHRYISGWLNLLR